MVRGLLFVSLLWLAGCPNGEDPPEAQWQLVHEALPGSLLSVWGTSETDVWMVGGDAGGGAGPIVLHYDGAWEQLDTGLDAGALWWVFGFEGGPVYMGGEGGTILRYQDGVFTPMTTPGTDTVFGIWGVSEDDVWAVGGTSGAATNGFVWRLSGDAWVPEETVPDGVLPDAAIWKVFGISADDVWLVGAKGVSLHWDGTSLTLAETGVGSSLFTVHGNASRYTAVGGIASGIIVEYEEGAWHNMTPTSTAPGLSGVYLGEGDEGVAVGQYGAVLLRDGAGWHVADTGYALVEGLHAVWVDPAGGIWVVGGHPVALTNGVLLHRGETLPEGDL